ncbi:glycosyltransferase family 4 protein [Mucilaginibacter myungsuensis]|uniref:glycosyltransferase family 4 protein n=1 Tax=Mucilaginibacter myungsuensis TaxID=649104 RepID=UPI001D166B73|nr:glycosyltransferase family 1 protein [Mucilaginibacter myungsuensis]MDN3600440.1 glycosyltransferase family 1 protein [Mucilaginibacter myungsuensis]
MQRIILIGNYQPDKQESMERFAQMLDKGFYKAGYHSEIWRPATIFGKLTKNTSSGLGKWMGYIDKYLIYPIALRIKLQKLNITSGNICFHICDHSNSIYLKHLPKKISSITCHDVLAMRGAMGFEDAKVPASAFGKILQRWILNGLKKANKLATVSAHTLKQLKELAPDINETEQDVRVIYNGFNDTFSVKHKATTKVLLSKAGLGYKTPYILHVGSDLQRKNRKLLVDMISLMKNSWSGYVYFAGKPIDDKLKAYATSLGVAEQIVSIVDPDHQTLEALYADAEAFIFPSFSEGFGWPLIEAQACGTPVITSDIEPMMEVTGGKAFYADPNKPAAYVKAFFALKDQTLRAEVVAAGSTNTERFGASEMINAYIDLFGWTTKTTGTNVN